MLKDFSVVKQILFSQNLIMHTPFFELCQDCCTVLEYESAKYRPLAKDGTSGGLLDFINNPLPSIIVPDIHGRPDFIYNILNYKLPSSIIDYSDRTVFHALKKNLIRIICVGDALHTEKNYSRWNQIQGEFDSGISTGPSMCLEMLDGLNTICGLMKLKILFPENVHFLKGNHENIMNRSGKGDFAFRKYADEGHMVRKFLFDMYGDDVIYMISCIEQALPVICANKNFVVSHAEPEHSYSRDEFINARQFPKIVEDLTWTDNGDAEDGSVYSVLENLCGTENAFKCLYFGGHRPVPEDFLLRQNGFYVQIHNPAKQNIVFVKPEDELNYKKLSDYIINVEKKSNKKKVRV